MLFVGSGPDRCAYYPSAHNIFHVSGTVYLPVVLPLFKMCHFIVLISLSSLGSGISQNIKWMGSKGIVMGLGMEVLVESGGDLA